jgi:hypothetical protein
MLRSDGGRLRFVHQRCGARTTLGTPCKLPRPCGHHGRKPYLFWRPDWEIEEDRDDVLKDKMVEDLRRELNSALGLCSQNITCDKEE